MLSIRFLLLVLAYLSLSRCSWASDPSILPNQDSKTLEKWYADRLKWNLETTLDAYEAIGRKDPKWNEDARQVLELTARMFVGTLPKVYTDDIYPLAQRAVKAGCDDPMVLFAYAHTSNGYNFPGEAEFIQRYAAAAKAMEKSGYHPLRHAFASLEYANQLLKKKTPTAEDSKQAEQMIDLTLSTLAKMNKKDCNRYVLSETFWIAKSSLEYFNKLKKDSKASFDRVDEQLAKMPALKGTRLNLKADFYMHYAWEARGDGVAGAVQEGAWEVFHERLNLAQEACEEAFDLDPEDAQCPPR